MDNTLDVSAPIFAFGKIDSCILVFCRLATGLLLVEDVQVVCSPSYIPIINWICKRIRRNTSNKYIGASSKDVSIE